MKSFQNLTFYVCLVELICYLAPLVNVISN